MQLKAYNDEDLDYYKYFDRSIPTDIPFPNPNSAAACTLRSWRGGHKRFSDYVEKLDSETVRPIDKGVASFVESGCSYIADLLRKLAAMLEKNGGSLY